MPNVQNLLANDHKDLMNKVRQFITGYGTFAAPIFAGVGDGTISDVASPPPSLAEVWTITCTLGGGVGVGIFSVSGSVSGAQASATVGIFYDGAGGLIEFLLNDGPIDFVIADVFTVTIVEGAMITAAQEWTQDRYFPAPNDILTGTNFDIPRRLFNANGANGFEAIRAGQTTAIVQWQVDDAVEYDQYTLAAQGSSFLIANVPIDWTLEWSDDGTTWIIEDTQVGFVAWIGGTEHNFPLTTPGRHFNWRIVITNNNGGTDVDLGYVEARVTGETLNSLAEGQCLFTGQGLAAADTIFVGMAIKEDDTVPYFNWRLRGAVAFDTAALFQNQPSSSPNSFYVLDDGTIEYWIVCTGRYFIVVSKIGTVYTSMQMGFHLPYGVPAEYGYPLVIAGSIGTLNVDFTNLGSHFRMFANPGGQAMRVRDPAGQWITLENYAGTGAVDQQSNIKCISPYAGNFDNVSAFMSKVTEGIDGSYPLTPLIICEFEKPEGELNKNGNSYGELDGVFHVSGSNTTPENTTVIGPDTYIMFPDIYRLAFDNFMAVRLDP